MGLDSPDVDGWQMGATSSSINDIANDNFVPILNIEEFTGGDNDEDDEGTALIINENTTITKSSNMLSVPTIRTSASDNSISNVLDFLGTNSENVLLSVPGRRTSAGELKSSGSDVSISFFLDREQMSDTYDENTFANVNTNVLDERNRKKSNANVTFQLDDE